MAIIEPRSNYANTQLTQCYFEIQVVVQANLTRNLTCNLTRTSYTFDAYGHLANFSANR